MKYIQFTLLAQVFNSISVLVDKYLLVSSIQHPLLYIFYISVFSLVAVFFLPFTKAPSPEVFILASLSTVLWTSGAYFMYKALQEGNASRVIPVIGTLISLFLLTESIITHTISFWQISAVFSLIVGLVFITLEDWIGVVGMQEVLSEFISAFLFAVSYVFLYDAYTKEHFLTVLVWSRFVLIPVGILILLIPAARSKVFTSDKQRHLNLFSKTGLLFLGGQGAGGASELLLTYAVSLANPVLVNSLQGVQYVFLYFGGIALSKKFPTIFLEESTLKARIFKLIGIIFIMIGLYVLAF